MALCGELLKQCSVCTRSVSMPLLLGFGWMHSQQLRSAWRRAGLCLGCTELRTDHRDLAPKQGWHRAKLTCAGSFCLTSLHMEQGRMGISACAREHRQLRWELQEYRKASLLSNSGFSAAESDHDMDLCLLSWQQCLPSDASGSRGGTARPEALWGDPVHA